MKAYMVQNKRGGGMVAYIIHFVTVHHKRKQTFLYEPAVYKNDIYVIKLHNMYFTAHLYSLLFYEPAAK